MQVHPNDHSGGAEITGNPLCRHVRSDEALCDFYAATFEQLFRRLVDPRTQVRETACEAMGAPACRLALRWQTPLPAHNDADPDGSLRAR